MADEKNLTPELTLAPDAAAVQAAPAPQLTLSPETPAPQEDSSTFTALASRLA